jgi:hypothetical protein
MTPTIPIKFNVNTTDPEKKLSFRAWFDGREVCLLPWVRESTPVEIEISDDEKSHVLELELFNKLPEHTRINAQGEVESDVCVEITDVSVDEIALSPWHLGTYHHDRNGTSEPQQEKFYGVMGCNGRVRIEFTTPIYLWLLEHM